MSRVKTVCEVCGKEYVYHAGLSRNAVKVYCSLDCATKDGKGKTIKEVEESLKNAL